MSLRTTGIDHVNLQVKDLDESIEFWKQLLGFRVLEVMPEAKGVIIGTQEAKLALYENKHLGNVSDQGYSYVSFHIENFAAAIGFCKENNIPILYERVVAWPKSQSLYIKDPTGYEVELTDTWGGGLA